ncbi:MAG: aminodeoxychorismate synthase component I [Janthinobacterium lividum]
MTLFDPTLPFVLLDDAGAGGSARLFTGLRDTITAVVPAELAPALDRLRAGRGHHAGFIGFDAGYALEPRLAALARPADDGLPLLWFGAFDQVETPDIDQLFGHGRAEVGPLEPGLAETDHAAMLGRIAALIAAGDIYQANLTFGASVAVSGHPLALYRHLRRGQAAPYGALIHTGAAWILSFSPELFFALDGRQLTARPMKGTARRGATTAEDAAAAAALAADPKNRAENLMIVDLLRNDLSRIAEPGSVAVPQLFTVERYPTLLQMTSTITATARAGIGPVETLTALFPCGSITGAPKIRAMEIIADVEPHARGLYTGSIGWIGPADGDPTATAAVFNVAIRTLVMAGQDCARIGLGSAIVADSDGAEEWRECLAKARFLAASGAPPDLIETMRCEGGTVARLDLHLARIAASATFLGYRFDGAAARAGVLATAAGGDGRLRLIASAAGNFAIQLSPLPPVVAFPVEIALSDLPVEADDWRLRHKTTDRGFYDAARVGTGAFETIFVRRDGRLTEGSFTNLFVPRGGRLLTPPLSDGLLPGVLRAALLGEGRAVEAPLTAADLAADVFIGNALRGLMPARLRNDAPGV